jgi:hypothetical protein
MYMYFSLKVTIKKYAQNENYAAYSPEITHGLILYVNVIYFDNDRRFIKSNFFAMHY